jgi:hypothetical protein
MGSEDYGQSRLRVFWLEFYPTRPTPQCIYIILLELIEVEKWEVKKEIK